LSRFLTFFNVFFYFPNFLSIKSYINKNININQFQREAAPQNSSNKYISFRLAKLTEIISLLNKLTLLMITVVIWCCVFDLFSTSACWTCIQRRICYL